MFKLSIEKPEDINHLRERIDEIKDIAKTLGYVNVKSLCYILMGPSYPVDGNSEKTGWTYNTICEGDGLELTEDLRKAIQYIDFEIEELGGGCLKMKEWMIATCVSCAAGGAAIAVACYVTKSAWPLLAFMLIPKFEFHGGGEDKEEKKDE